MKELFTFCACVSLKRLLLYLFFLKFCVRSCMQGFGIFLFNNDENLCCSIQFGFSFWYWEGSFWKKSKVAFCDVWLLMCDDHVPFVSWGRVVSLNDELFCMFLEGWYFTVYYWYVSVNPPWIQSNLAYEKNDIGWKRTKFYKILCKKVVLLLLFGNEHRYHLKSSIFRIGSENDL